jgi:hypothetical protein
MKVMSPRALGAMAAALATVALAAPAGAAPIELSGTQTVVDENAGTFKMHGSLVGDWAITQFNVQQTAPVFKANGTEHFAGCLDRDRDSSCKGDPSGAMDFIIEYSALFDPVGSQNLVWGACLHPVTGGTGAFAGARGVLAFVDTPTRDGVRTRYIGNLTLAGKRGHGAGRAQASATTVSAPHACGS